MATPAAPAPVDVDFVIQFEQGLLCEDEVVRGFQALIDSGAVWHLQGSYGRLATHLLQAGLCVVPGQPSVCDGC